MANTTKMTVAEIFQREAERVAGVMHQAGKQINGISKREYQGFNKINLYLVKKERGFNSNEWLTFEQAKNEGLQVKEGEHGTPVFTYKLIEKDGKKQKVLRYYLVFNKDQIEAAK